MKINGLEQFLNKVDYKAFSANPKNTKDKLDKAYLAFENTPKKTSKMKEEAENIIIEQFLYRLLILKNKNGEAAVVPLLEELQSNDNEEELERIRQISVTLQEKLTEFAKSSDSAAHFTKQLFGTPYFYLAIADNDGLSALKNFDKNFGGAYGAQSKGITFPFDVIEGKDFDIEKLQELLCHEFTHAIDDLFVLDTKSEKPAFGSHILTKQIIPSLHKEWENNKKIIEELKQARKNQLIKRSESLGFEISQKSIENLMEISLKTRPIHRIDPNSPEEIKILKDNTWCWYQFSDEYIIAPFISYLAKGMDINKTGDRYELLQEYLAYSMQFYLSNDESKKERLKKFDPKFCKYIEETLLSALTRQSIFFPEK
ncbi:MAG: hypothetical protein ABIH00_07215 [Armatimonadota bacterium]